MVSGEVELLPIHLVDAELPPAVLGTERIGLQSEEVIHGFMNVYARNEKAPARGHDSYGSTEAFQA